MPWVTILNTQKLVYVETSKVASTTMAEVMHALAGLRGYSGNPRKLARKKSVARDLTGLGLERRRVAIEDLPELSHARHDFTWVAVKRDPKKRILSSYRSKIHRYAMAFDRKAYRRGILGQLMEGIKGFDDSRYLAKHVAKSISFEQMMLGLKDHGLSFDSHFILQTQAIGFDDIRYDMILAQENLEEDLRTMCDSLGVGFPFEDGLRKLNESFGSAIVEIVQTPLSDRLVSELYREDFEKFGYPFPT